VEEMSEDDFEDFLAKVESITSQLEDIKNGNSPTKEKSGEKQEEELKKNFEETRQEALRKLEEKKRLHASKKKQEEIDQWWEHARLVHDGADDSKVSSLEEKKRLQAAERWRRSHDANDYSRWDTYLQDLDDPIAREQKAILKKQKEDTEMDEFEKRNKEWCDRMREDMAGRKEKNESKKKRCERFRKEGNTFYKRKKYERAKLLYHEGLKLCPFDVKVLTNLSQCHWKQKQYEDTIEFASRAIFLNKTCVKALSRRAAAYRMIGHLNDAANDLNVALSIEKHCDSLSLQRATVLYELRRKKEDSIISSSSSSSDCDNYWKSWVNDKKRSYHVAREKLQQKREEAIRCRVAGGLNLIAHKLMEEEEETPSKKILVNLLINLTSQNEINRTELRLKNKSFVKYVLKTSICLPLMIEMIERDEMWRELASNSVSFLKILLTHVLSTFSVQGANVFRLLSLNLKKNHDDVIIFFETLSLCLEKSRHRPKKKKEMTIFRQHITKAIFHLTCGSHVRGHLRRRDDDKNNDNNISLGMKRTIKELVFCFQRKDEVQDTKNNASAALSNALLCDRTIVKHIESDTSRLLEICLSEKSPPSHLDVLLTRCASLSEVSARQVSSKLEDLVNFFLQVSKNRQLRLVSLLAHAVRVSTNVTSSSLLFSAQFVKSLVDLVRVENNAVICGNTIQILIYCVNNNTYHDGYNTQLKGLVHHLVDILKSSKHVSARKNAAVLLAKLARSHVLMKEIRKVRGMEILLSLGRDGELNLS